MQPHLIPSLILFLTTGADIVPQEPIKLQTSISLDQLVDGQIKFDLDHPMLSSKNRAVLTVVLRLKEFPNGLLDFVSVDEDPVDALGCKANAIDGSVMVARQEAKGTCVELFSKLPGEKIYGAIIQSKELFEIGIESAHKPETTIETDPQSTGPDLRDALSWKGGFIFWLEGDHWRRAKIGDDDGERYWWSWVKPRLGAQPKAYARPVDNRNCKTDAPTKEDRRRDLDETKTRRQLVSLTFIERKSTSPPVRTGSRCLPRDEHTKYKKTLGIEKYHVRCVNLRDTALPLLSGSDVPQTADATNLLRLRAGYPIVVELILPEGAALKKLKLSGNASALQSTSQDLTKAEGVPNNDSGTVRRIIWVFAGREKGPAELSIETIANSITTPVSIDFLVERFYHSKLSFGISLRYQFGIDARGQGSSGFGDYDLRTEGTEKVIAGGTSPFGLGLVLGYTHYLGRTYGEFTDGFRCGLYLGVEVIGTSFSDIDDLLPAAYVGLDISARTWDGFSIIPTVGIHRTQILQEEYVVGSVVPSSFNKDDTTTLGIGFSFGLIIGITPDFIRAWTKAPI